MALQAIVSDIETIPEELRSLYTEQDGKHVLEVEDLESHPGATGLKSALEGERTARRDADKAAKDLKAAIKKFDGIDPDKAREAEAKLLELNEQELLDAGKVDELLAQKTERMKADFEKRIETMTGTMSEKDATVVALETKLADLQIFGALEKEALERGVRKLAIEDVINRARNVWKLVEGDPRPIKPGTDEVLYGKSGEIMTMGEYIETLASERPHLFEENRGSGARGSNDDGTGGVRTVGIDQMGSNLEDIASGKVSVTL